jgi:hypothetical protein
MPSPEIDDLARQMHQVRTSMGLEVHELVENARAITDWRRYWRSHPWAWCGAAAVVGFLVVPKSRSDGSDARTLAEAVRAEIAKASANGPPTRRPGIMADLTGMAVGFVVQRGIQMLGRRLEELLSSHSASPAPPRAAAQRSQERS